MLRRLIASLVPHSPAKRRQKRISPCQFQALEPRLLLSTISGRVWLDANINGIQDPEINGFESEFEDGLAAITVELYNNSNQLLDTTSTDNDGLFSFTGLDAGSYKLKYDTTIDIDSTEHQLTFQNATFGQANLPTMDSDANTLSGQTNVIVLGEDETVDDQGAGYAPIFSLVSGTSVVVGQNYNFELDFALPDYLTGYPTTIEWYAGDSDHDLSITEQTTNNSMGDLFVTVDFDTYDSNHFFDTQFKRDLLQYAASSVANRFGDTLLAIEPDENNSWTMGITQPDFDLSSLGENEGEPYIEIEGGTIAQNEILIFTGATDLGSSTLGTGGPGSYGAFGFQDFFDILQGRGQAGALGSSASQTDVSLWGGSIRFDTDSNWYFGLNTDDIGFSQYDFLSVAMHEMLHAYGFGISDSWDNLVSSGTFTGTESTSLYGSNPPLNQYNSHFQNGLTDPDTGEEAAMDPTITNGVRKGVTAIDYAAMDDIGWDLLDAPTVSSGDQSGVATGTNAYGSTGTKTVTFTILTEYGNLTYQIDLEVLDAAQVSDVQINAANFTEDIDDPALISPNFSSSIQRSILKSVVFTFNREMEDISTSDLSLKIIYQDGTSDDVVLNDASVSTADNTTFTLDMREMILTDGVYELTIKDTVVDAISLANLDGNTDDDNQPGGNYVSDRFHQLNGDFNGDAIFNAADLGAVQYYWNGNHADPPAYIDINGDNIVDGDDMPDNGDWQKRLDLEVEELVVESLAIESPSPQQSNMALALAAYQTQQSSLKIVQSDDQSGDEVEYEDLIGQWL